MTAEALVDGDTRLSFAELGPRSAGSPGPPWPRASSPGTGWPSGPRTWPSGCRRPGPARGRGRPGPAEHPLQGRRGRLRRPQCSGAQALFTVRGFLGIDYPALLEDEDVGRPERIVLLRDDGRSTSGRRPTRSPSSAGRSSAGARTLSRRADTWSAADDGRQWARWRSAARRPLRHHLHLGDDRPPQGGGDHPRPDPADLRRPGLGGRPDRGRPLPGGEPLLPHLRLQGRASWPASWPGPPSSPSPSSTSTGCWSASRRERITVLPGPPTLYQSLLAHPAGPTTTSPRSGWP